MDTDPLCESCIQSVSARRTLSNGARRLRDAIARRYEPRCEGICRRSRSGRSGRPHPVAVHCAAIKLRSALLVNPYDAESVANAVSQALAMPLEERRARQKAL